MNKLQALLIAGLLSLSSVSFASMYTAPSTTLGFTGDVELSGNDFDTFAFGEIYNNNGIGDVQTFVISNLGPVEEFFTFGASIRSNPLVSEAAKLTLYSDATLLTSIAGFGSDTFKYLFDIGTTYYLKAVQGDGLQGSSLNVSVTPVPVPAAGILFASALFGAGALGRRKKKAKASVVGAFARAS